MTSPLEALQNLVKIGKLKAEPPDQAEFDGLVRSAGRKLPDARNPGVSPDSRFILAYDAAHSLALAALRWQGFRSENRYIVFQVLGSTASFPVAKWRKTGRPWRPWRKPSWAGACRARGVARR